MVLPENPPPHANLTPTQMRQGIARLKRRIAEVEANDLTRAGPDELSSTFANVFGRSTVEYDRYESVVRNCWKGRRDLVSIQGDLWFVLNDALSFLTEELEVAAIDDPPDGRPEGRPDECASTSTVPGSKVFIVHGHDDAARHAVARFLEQLGLEAVILQEQSNQGRTIIEKFEDSAGEVGFAVVLMTPDDIAGPAAAPSSATRARQNVIFELGYFSAKLGRGRTCVHRKGDVEIPSDLYGVLYIELDDRDGWKLEFAKELKAAGLKINMDGML
jgi:predicted nucleotide-binding protein